MTQGQKNSPMSSKLSSRANPPWDRSFSIKVAIGPFPLLSESKFAECESFLCQAKKMDI